MSRARSTLHEFMPYGAPDLLADAPGALTGALAAGMLGWAMLFAIALSLASLWPAATPRSITHEVWISPAPPAALEVRPEIAPPPIARVTARANSGVITPVAAPESRAIADPEPAIAGGGDAIAGDAPSGTDATPGSGAMGEPDDYPPPTTYVLHDIEPEVLTRVVPTYPEMAIALGVSGKVRIRALVGRDGRVSEALVVSGDPLLGEAALEAARRTRFAPASADGHPVAVWVVLPYDFVTPH